MVMDTTVNQDQDQVKTVGIPYVYARLRRYGRILAGRVSTAVHIHDQVINNTHFSITFVKKTTRHVCIHRLANGRWGEISIPPTGHGHGTSWQGGTTKASPTATHLGASQSPTAMHRPAAQTEMHEAARTVPKCPHVFTR